MKSRVKRFLILSLLSQITGGVALSANQICQPVRYYSYATTSAYVMGSMGTIVFSKNIPDSGYAVARFTGTFVNSDSNNTYSWNASVSVGEAKASWTAADDICPGHTATKINMGYGLLKDGKKNVSVNAGDIYTAVYGKGGRVVLNSGAKLEVWVEDANCPQSQIQFSSYYNSAGTTNTWAWPTSMASIRSLSLTKPDSVSGSVLVMSTAEGTPALNPNTKCAQESATLVSQIVGPSGVLAQNIEAIPASTGQGHLVMSSSASVALTALPKTANFSLLLGSNAGTTTTTTGGCCGDASIATILLTDKPFTLPQTTLPSEDGLGSSAWCGFSAINAGTRANSIAMVGATGNWNYSNPSMNCRGASIASGCPAGYSKFYFGTVTSSDDSIADTFFSCVKTGAFTASANAANNLQGKFCGASIVNYGSHSSAFIDGRGDTADLLCQGKKPLKEGCPSGYRQVAWGAVAWTVDSQADWIVSCIRESSEIVAATSNASGSFCGLTISNQGSAFAGGIYEGSLPVAKSYSSTCQNQDILTKGCPSGYKKLSWSVRSQHSDTGADTISTCVLQ